MSEPKPITAQHWLPVQDKDGVSLIGQDGSTILRMARPDTGSDLFLAGYIVGLHAAAMKERSK